MISMKSRILFASAASLLLISACNSDQQTSSAAPAVKDAAEATVNGVAIKKSRVDLIVKQNKGQADSPEARKAIIDQLVLQTLLSEEAKKKGLDKSAEVTEQIDLTRQSLIANAYVQDFIKNNSVTDDMLKAEYERIKSTAGNEYKARHILVEKEAEAVSIIAKLKKDSKAFEKLAKEKSIDVGSKAKGGDLGWFDLRRMVPEFGGVVSKLEKGKFTEEPVKTAYGYHVILLEDSKPMEPPPFDVVKSSLTQQLQQQSVKKQLDDLKAKAKIEIVEAPAAAKAEVPAPAK